MKLAIVGSVRLAGNKEAYDIIRSWVSLPDVDEVVSGGADGIDSMAIEIAKELGKPYKEYKPKAANWNAYKERNILVAGRCTDLLRIVSKYSTTYGSGWTRDLAAKMGKTVAEYIIDDKASITD